MNCSLRRTVYGIPFLSTDTVVSEIALSPESSTEATPDFLTEQQSKRIATSEAHLIYYTPFNGPTIGIRYAKSPRPGCLLAEAGSTKSPGFGREPRAT